MCTIETGRLVIRPITKQDAPDIFEYSKDISVGPNAGWKPHESLAESEKIMDSVFIDQQGVWGIVLKENGKMIGSLGLIDDPKREYEKAKMLGYALHASYWGKGIMTEAVQSVLRYGFEQMGLDVISAYCYPFNRRSAGVLLKCGFAYEGTLQKAEQLYDGNVYDHACYILTADKFSHT